MNTKVADADAPAVGNWVQTKFLEKDLQNATKTGILKNDPTEVHIAGPEKSSLGLPRYSG
jgi:hypothetical protein